MSDRPVYFHEDPLKHYTDGSQSCADRGHVSAFCGKHGDPCQGPEAGEQRECLNCVLSTGDDGMGIKSTQVTLPGRRPERELVPA